MKLHSESLVPRVRSSESGQVIALVMVCIMTFLALGALTVDLGNYYIAVQKLNTATQAAALGGAQQLVNFGATAATTQAKEYSADASSDYNYSSTLDVTSITVTVPPCLTTTNVACYNPTGAASGANAIEVQETAQLNTIFAKLVGIPTLTITSTAWASAAGGIVGPYNIALIVDTTDSMTSTDSGTSNCGTARITCAMAGYQALLENLDPCSPLSGQACNASGVLPLNVVSLWTFPGLTTTAEQPDDWCGTTEPAVQDYKAADKAVYQITPWTGTDLVWRTNDTTPYLNPSADISRAMGVSGTLNKQCTNTNVAGSGVWVKGGVGTYYAGIITAAQAALVTEQAQPGRGNAQNVMILVSDGEAQSGYTDTSTAKQQCHEAITAAQNAVQPNALGQYTWIYTVAYGAESSGCTTDTAPTITPCQTMEDIATNPDGTPNATRFFSDYSATGGTTTCVGRSQSNTELTYIFKEIAGDLTVARLIPIGTQ